MSRQKVDFTRFASVVLLATLLVLVAGCGCSRQPTDPATAARAKDEAYLAELRARRADQTKATKARNAVQNAIRKLGAKPETKPEYAALTNQLAQCEEAKKRADKKAADVIRARILKQLNSNKGKRLDTSSKGNK